MEMPNGGSLDTGYCEVEKGLGTWRAARKARLAAGKGFVASRTSRVTGANAKEAASAFDSSVRNAENAANRTIRNAEDAADRTSAHIARRASYTAMIAGGAASLPILAASVPIEVHGRYKVRKADDAEDLPIPEWARNAWSMAPTRIVSPLDMYAGSAMAAEGYRKVSGKRVWPWQRGRVKTGGLEMAQGRAMMDSPLGAGRIQ